MKQLCLALIISFLILVKSNDICYELLSKGTTEKVLVEELENNIGIYRNELSCIEVFLKRGYYILSQNFLNLLQKNKVNFKVELNKAVKNINRELDEIEYKYRFDETDYKNVSPAFMWAQSLTNVYIMIKFAHLHDSPGCLELKNEEIGIFPNYIYFKGYCVQGEVPIKFTLNVNLFGEIIKEESSWNASSVGRLQITLKKKNFPIYWKNINKEGTTLPNNIKVWSDMKEKFKNELTEYEDNN